MDDFIKALNFIDNDITELICKRSKEFDNIFDRLDDLEIDIEDIGIDLENIERNNLVLIKAINLLISKIETLEEVCDVLMDIHIEEFERRMKKKWD